MVHDFKALRDSRLLSQTITSLPLLQKIKEYFNAQLCLASASLRCCTVWKNILGLYGGVSDWSKRSLVYIFFREIEKGQGFLWVHFGVCVVSVCIKSLLEMTNLTQWNDIWNPFPRLGDCLDGRCVCTGGSANKSKGLKAYFCFILTKNSQL